MRPPAEMRREVRAKERGVWMRLANRLYAGNGTNHGYSSGVCCSLFIFLFSYISVLFTSLFLITLSSTPIPLFHCCVPHESCDRASHTSLSVTPTSILPSNPPWFFFPPPPAPNTSCTLVFYSLPTLLYIVHSPSSDYYAVCSH